MRAAVPTWPATDCADDLHQETLGSLEATPYLVVQRSAGRAAMEPVFDEEEGLEAIRAFARDCMGKAASTPAVVPPAECCLRRACRTGTSSSNGRRLEAFWRCRIQRVAGALERRT